MRFFNLFSLDLGWKTHTGGEKPGDAVKINLKYLHTVSF